MLSDEARIRNVKNVWNMENIRL